MNEFRYVAPCVGKHAKEKVQVSFTHAKDMEDYAIHPQELINKSPHLSSTKKDSNVI